MASRFSGVYNRMTSLIKPKRGAFNAEQFRKALMGLVLTCTMNEILSYMLLRKSVEAGEVPYVILDIVFGCISFISVLALPFLCWVGSARRVTVMTAWLLLAPVFILPLFFMPYNITASGELCNAVPVAKTALSALSAFRLVVIIALALVNALAGPSIWAQGIAVSEIHSPGTVAMDLATILGFKVFIMVGGFDIMYDFIQNKLWLQLAILLVQPLGSIVFFRRSYENRMMKDEVADYDNKGYGFFSSLTSVLTNRWAMVHSLLIALLVTAIWGFLLNDYDATKAKYLVTWSYSTANMVLVCVKGFLIVCLIKLNGYDYSAPIATAFDKSAATVNSMKQASRAIIGLVLLVFIGCNKAAIEGAHTGGYNVPNCGLGCGCRAPGSDFNPVCMLDTYTTYFSPCHAGCRATLESNYVTTYTNCSCAGAAGRAIPGACLNADCEIKNQAHQLISAIVIGFAIIAIMMHLMLVLRSVRAREKSIAIGVSFSMTAIVAFIGGHLGYRGIAMNTCLYWDGGKCQLQSENFGLIVYCLSIAIMSLACIINVVVWRLYNRQQKQEASEKSTDC